MKKTLFKYYNRLGFMNPFYTEKNNYFIIDDSLEKILKQKNEPNIIDPVGIIEILTKNYTFADRTIIQDVHKTPWMAKPNKHNNSWAYVDDLPQHGHIIVKEEEAADVLYQKLLGEIKEYIGDSSNVGILLSGGMDSRIIAAIIKNLQISGEINANIIALTWGIDNSRDVVYAKKIVDLFEWEWKYFELSPENLIENIEVCAKNGALYSPTHLHAMPKIRELKNIDCIIAGSFGDSVGRSEYSGIKVKNLTSTASGAINRFKIIKNNIYKTNFNNIQDDIEKYRLLFPRQENYQYYELEKQLHYMRKQLNQCMSIIDQKIPLFQAFTSPEVFGYMWSLSPDVRNDKIYYFILEKHANDLLDIPWARTGCRYLSKNCDNPDNYLKNYHNYGKWIREDIWSIIEEKVLSPNIEKLNVFNMRALKNLLYINSMSNKRMIVAEERLIWIASLSDMVEKYEIKGLDFKNESIRDKFDSNIVGPLHYLAYKLKNLLRG